MIMATHKTVIAEKQIALADRTGLSTVPQLAAIHTRAGVHVATAEFTMPASMAANDLIAICNVPCGARMLPQLSFIASEGVGTLQLTVGTQDVADAYSASLTVTAAGSYQLTKGSLAFSDKPMDATMMLYAKVGGTPAVTAGKRLVFSIAYGIQ